MTSKEITLIQIVIEQYSFANYKQETKIHLL